MSTGQVGDATAVSVAGAGAQAGKAADAVVLNASQSRVLALPDLDSGSDPHAAAHSHAHAAVVGAPGSGKTTTLVELVADRVLGRGWDAESVLALTSSRATATALRDRIAARLQLPTNGPMARSATSLAFEIASTAAVREGRHPLRLITGGEQDNDFAQLLAGHLDTGGGPDWPPHLGPQVRELRGFRSELRDLYTRITEHGITLARARDLADEAGVPEWRAAAVFFAEYLDVVGMSRPGQTDAADLAALAVEAIDRGDLGDRLARLRLVAIDDFHEATHATFTLLRALAARGVQIVALGDPDVAANTFRGGDPHSLRRFASILGVPHTSEIVLSTVYRHGPEIRRLVSKVTNRVGAAGEGLQRAAHAVTPEPTSARVLEPVVRIEAPTLSRQFAAIARELRERHLFDSVPFGEMVVVVRSSAQVSALARALSLAEVPTRTTAAGRPLRDDRAASALLSVVDLGMGRSLLDAEAATGLLLSPFGGIDALGVRRLRLALRAEELTGGGSRLGPELLADALAAPGRFATIDSRIARRAERMASTLAEVGAAASAASTIEELLWLVWERSGLADRWRDQALGAGIVAAEANRDLDGVLALFTAAKRFVEREPASPPSVFLDQVLDADVPEDTLSPQALGDTVLVTTPSGVVGSAFDVVVAASVQEAIWPNLRLRGSLLHAQQLIERAEHLDSGTTDARKDVLHDELRMFALTVSRARRQVIVAAVASEEEAPSAFFALLDTAPRPASSSSPLSLRGLTGRLRREIARSNNPGHPDGAVDGRGKTARHSAERRAQAASALALLAREKVPGASPEEWHGLLDVSSLEPMFLPEETVPVSPSQMKNIEDSPLDWFISKIGGSDSSSASRIGTIVHWAMEHSADSTVDRLFEAIESRWAELPFESPWVSAAQKVAVRKLATGVAEYLGDFEREGGTLAGAELKFTLEVGRAELKGSIDRVERGPDGAVVIVDLKTGRAETSAEQIAQHPQLGAYQLAYASGQLDATLDAWGAHHSGGAKLLWVKEGVRGKAYRVGEQAPLTEEQLDGFRRRIEQVAALMAASSFAGPMELDAWGLSSAAGMLHRVRAVSSDDGRDAGRDARRDTEASTVAISPTPHSDGSAFEERES